jgi:diguanylate cyclase (GGDEF)-like protein
MHQHRNNRRFLRLLTTPGSIPTNIAFAVSVVVMLGIFFADFFTNEDIQLHILYVFPIALVVMHHDSPILIVISMIFAVIFMSVTLTHYGLSTLSVLINVVIGISAYCAMTYFSYSARANYLKAMNSATVDPLTELLNRRGLEPILGLEVARWKRYGEVFSLAMLDLDGFKQLNDEKGHRAGDEALKLFAQILRANIRESDTVARIGGDEFVLLMPHAAGMETNIICEKLCADVEAQMRAQGFGVTVSIGCKTFSDVSAVVADVLDEADKAMYEAKNGGKNCVVYS